MRSLAVLLMTGTVLGCATTPLPSERSTATVEILELSPTLGTAVGVHDVVVATIRYEIRPYHRTRGLYHLGIQFDTTSPGRTVSRMEGVRSADRVLDSASGTATIRYPLRGIHPVGELKRPLTARLTIHQKTGPHSNVIIGHSEKFSFEVSDHW
jgi:hypothetical protein